MNYNATQCDVATLNDLTALCIDSARGYREAAGQSGNASFAELCVGRAEERDRLAREFQHEVRQMGGMAAEGGTLASGAHRLLLDVRVMIGNHVKAAIDEVERGEDVIKGAFEKALNRTDICQRTRSMISLCYTSIRHCHDEMAALKHAMG